MSERALTWACASERRRERTRPYPHNPKVAGSNPAPATKCTRSEALSAQRGGPPPLSGLATLVHAWCMFRIRPAQTCDPREMCPKVAEVMTILEAEVGANRTLSH